MVRENVPVEATLMDLVSDLQRSESEQYQALASILGGLPERLSKAQALRHLLRAGAAAVADAQDLVSYAAEARERHPEDVAWRSAARDRRDRQVAAW